VEFSQIKFLPPQPNSGEVLASTDILVLMSECESCPLAILEAMAMGIPTVSFDIDELPQITEGSGLVVPYGDLENFISKLQFLIDNPEKRKNLGFSGRKNAKERYSTEKMQQSINWIFSEF